MDALKRIFGRLLCGQILDKLIGRKLDMKECHVAVTNGDHIVVL